MGLLYNFATRRLAKTPRVRAVKKSVLLPKIIEAEIEIALVMDDEIPCPHCGTNQPMYDCARFGDLHRLLWFDLVQCCVCKKPVLVFYHTAQAEIPQDVKPILKWKYKTQGGGGQHARTNLSGIH